MNESVRHVLDSLPVISNDMVVITRSTRELPIVYVNEAFTKISGYSQEEVLGRNPKFLQSPDTDAETRLLIHQALDESKPVRTEILNIAKDGVPYYVELSIVPHFDNGVCTHFISVQRDVTERKRLIEELSEYKKFFDETPVAFLRTDIRTGQFLLANEYCATVLGYDSVQDLLDHGCSTSLYCDPSVRAKLIRKIRSRGEISNFEMKLVLRDKREVWVNANLHVNCGGSCVEGSLTDITVAKQTELELESLKKKQLVSMKSVKHKLAEFMQDYDR